MLARRRGCGGWLRAGSVSVALLAAAAFSGAVGCNDNGAPATSAGAGGFDRTGAGGTIDTGAGGGGGSGGSPFGTGGGGGSSTLIGGAPDASGAGGATMVSDPGDAQTPPMGQANMMAWLATNQYKKIGRASCRERV